MSEWTARMGKARNRTGDVPRDPWQRDRARIIHSASFRRLQSKTQVLGLGENDFYRTRLTHSLEVAQIGSGIAHVLKHRNQDRPEVLEWLPSTALIETICLAHDMGHPPFGHGGEIALNYRMRHQGGFEGNGQTLRILTRLGEYSQGFGLDLTRRSLLGVLKYPALYEDVQKYPQSVLDAEVPDLQVDLEDWRPPKCVFADEAGVLDWILDPFEDADRALFRELGPGRSKFGHLRTKHKALDTSIMELADDIAYGIHDLEDAVVLRLVDREHWEDEIAEPIRKMGRSPLASKIDAIGKDLFTNRSFYRKNAIGELVHHFVDHAEIIEKEEFTHPLLRFNARFDPMVAQELEFFVRFISKNVIFRPELQMLVYKGQQMVLKLAQVIQSNPDKLLPLNIREKWESSEHPDRTICDFMSGMTDLYAERMFRRLFVPGEGSVFDRL